MIKPDSPHSHHAKAAERWALQSEAMGLRLKAARKRRYWSELQRKKADRKPSTREAIAPARSMPRSSDLTSPPDTVS
jgi:hypothetical protein